MAKDDEFPRIPGYQIIDVIGAGGQGTVYLAQQISLQRRVAIKVLKSATSADPQLARNFVREARVASRFHHPNILQAIDVGKVDGRLYFVMEYIAGLDAFQVTKSRGPLSEAEVIEIGKQVASALQYTASQGVFHGDIKPENLVIMEDGTVKVVDFGIAGLLRDKDTAVSGTEGFIAPEVAKGQPVGPGSDLYSLGVTLCELLTGDIPQARTDLSEQLRGASPAFVGVLKRLLQPSPEARYADAAKVIRDLERVTEASTRKEPGSRRAGAPAGPVLASTKGRRRRRSLVRGDLTGIVLMVVTLATVGWVLRDADLKATFSGDTTDEVEEDASGVEPNEERESGKPEARLKIESPMPGEVLGGDVVTVRGTVSTFAGLSLFIGEEPVVVQDGTFEHPWRPRKGGAQEIAVVVRADEVGIAAESIPVVVDRTAPEIVIEHPKESVVRSRDVKVAGLVRDASATTLTLNGRPIDVAESGAWSADVDLRREGPVLKIVARDAFERMTVKSLELRLDAFAPKISLGDVPALTSESELRVQATVPDDGEVEVVSFNGEKARRVGTSWHGVVSLEEGRNEITVSAADRWGNEHSEVVTVELDRTPPVVQVESRAIECVAGKPVAVLGTVREKNGVVVRVAGKPATIDSEGRWAVDVPGPRRPRTYEVVARDEVGNKSEPIFVDVAPATAVAKERRRRGQKIDRRSREAIDRALDWLARHQSPDGSWDADDFMENGDKELGELCDGAATQQCDVGVTALALLAFFGDGQTPAAGEHRLVVSKGLEWLLSRQDADDGEFGGVEGRSTKVYCLALASLAIVDGLNLTGSRRLEMSARAAVKAVLARQNPYKAWRYWSQGGENDTSVTAWMIQVLWNARQAGIEVPEDNLSWALEWIDEMTDEESGRTGYIKQGEPPVRGESVREKFPPEHSESLTAAGLLARVLCEGKSKNRTLIVSGLKLFDKALPTWSDSGATIDMYYWYYGSTALYHFGGSRWSSWRKALHAALLPNQRKDGNAAGSWDPKGAWGYAGGRVYATAICTLALQAEYRQLRP